MKRRLFHALLIIAFLAWGAPCVWAGMSDFGDGIQLKEISAPSGDPATNKGWLYVKDNSGTSALYFEDDGGTVVQLGTGATTAWDDIGNPDANDSISFGTYTMTLTGAHVAADGFTIQNTGNFGDISILKVQQTTGNPTNGTVLEVISADTDADALVVTANSTSPLVVAGDGQVTVGAGAAVTINGAEFDVSGSTGAITIDDGGNAGSVTVEGTVLDINSLDFVGAGAVTCAASSAITINPDSGNAAGEDLIITAHNVQLTATGALTMSPDAAVTTAIDVSDTDYTNAISIGTNAITGSNFSVNADGDVTCVDITASGTVSIGTIAQDAFVPASAAPHTLTIDGAGAGGVTIGATSTGDVTLGDDVVVSDGYNVTIGEGKLLVDDDVNETAVEIQSSSSTTGSALLITASSTSGKTISVTSDDITSGTMLYLDNDQAGSFTGKYIQCYDGSADDFSVSLNGATVIAGAASTDMLTISAGDIQITTGDIDLDDGIIAVNNDADEANNITRNYAGAGTNPVLSVVEDHTSSTNVALKVENDGTGNSTCLQLSHDGDYPVIDIDAGAARTGDVIDINMANMLAERALVVSGAMTSNSNEGVIDVHTTGNIASTGTLLRLDADTGTPAGTQGFIIYVDDDSGAQAGAYAVEINSANNEGLKVSAGESTFTEVSHHTGGLDVDEDIDIDFDANDEEISVVSTAADYAAGSGIITVYDDSTGQTNASYLLRLAREANGDAQDNFILCEDNSTGAAGNGDDMFKVDTGGAVTAAGAISTSSTVTATAGASVGNAADSYLKTDTVELSNADIKALRGTKKELIAAPGAGNFIEVVSVVLILDYGSDVLTESADNLVVQYATSGDDITAAIEMTGFIDQNADTIMMVYPSNPLAANASADMLNNAVELFNTGDGEFGGNASNDTTMTVKITYRVHAGGL